MTIDEQMKMWERNAKDPFGRLLKRIIRKSAKYFATEKDEYGIPETPLSKYLTMYSLDGPSKRSTIARSVVSTLNCYDIIENDKMIRIMVKRLQCIK